MISTFVDHFYLPRIATPDLGFPRVGTKPEGEGGGANLLFIMWKNCMKVKKIEPRKPGGGGGHPKFCYVDPPLDCKLFKYSIFFSHYLRKVGNES